MNPRQRSETIRIGTKFAPDNESGVDESSSEVGNVERTHAFDKTALVRSR